MLIYISAYFFIRNYFLLVGNIDYDMVNRNKCIYISVLIICVSVGFVKGGPIVNAYLISQEIAKQIAVGLYREVGEYVATAKRDNPGDYEHFKSDYLAKQAAQSPSPNKRRYARKRQNMSR